MSVSKLAEHVKAGDVITHKRGTALFEEVEAIQDAETYMDARLGPTVRIRLRPVFGSSLYALYCEPGDILTLEA